MKPRFSRLLLIIGCVMGAAGAHAAPFASERLLAELTRCLADHFNTQGDFQLELVRPWTPPACSASDWQVVVTEFPPIESANMLVRFRLLADGVPAGETTLLLRASLWRDMWFAREPIVAGAIFNPGVLEARRVDCLREHGGLPADTGDTSLMFARDVPADRMLTWRDVAHRRLVHKGELVQVTAAEGQLSLTMKALALQNGAKGDLITVRNLESLKDISGTVVGDHRVEVSF